MKNVYIFSFRETSRVEYRRVRMNITEDSVLFIVARLCQQKSISFPKNQGTVRLKRRGGSYEMASKRECRLRDLEATSWFE